MEQIVCNINMAFEYFTFFYVIFHKEYRKLQKINIIGLITCLLIWIIGIVAGFDWQAVSIGPIPVFFILIYIVMWILFDVSVVETAVWGIGEWLILSMLETALYLMLQPLQLESNVLDNIIMLLISCIFWMFYVFVRKKCNVQVFKLPIKMWCLIDVIMFILTAMMTFFTYVFVQDFPNNRIMFMGQMLSVLGETIIVVLIFAMLYLCNSTYDFYRQKELAEMQNKQQREYFLQLLEREEETKRFRHDIINDLLEMHNYCVNQNYKQMECYLENTLGIVQKISKSNYDVGNDIVNTVINYYLKPIKEICSIEINGYMSEKLAVDDRDLCIISANLIKTQQKQSVKWKMERYG